MVYSTELLDLSLDNIINAQSTGAGPAVKVLFNGSGVHTVGGPTPFVDISTSVEANSVGIPEAITTKITLTGKIVRPQTDTPTGSGISHVVSGIKRLIETIFRPDIIGEFKIECGTTSPATIYSASGVRVVGVDVTKTNDNWIQTADYTVVLEGYKSAISGYSVKGMVDSWSIESLEDYTYSNFAINNISQKQEYHNPNLKPVAPSAGAPQPGGSQSGGGGGMSPSANASLNVISIPQFKVSRTVGAVGIPSGTGMASGLLNTSYLNAKRWVEDRLAISLQTVGSNKPPSGIISLSGTPSGGTIAPNLATGYLYNHMRNTNFSITEGRYEVVDNWLAMPTGIGHIEDYSIEMQTDDKYIHTVSVKGEIRGLSFAGSSLGNNNTHVTGQKINAPTIGGSFGTLSHKGPDTDSTSSVNTIAANKYQNALSGWIYDVKPYLYRRASVAMNTADRTVGYIPPYNMGGAGAQSAPNNPVYCKHGLLNIIPVSTSESHNTRKGTISYSYDFNNKFTIISGVISENVSIEDTGPTDVVGEAFVLGRALGPVLQNLGTKTSAKKQVTVEVTVVPPSSLKGFFLQNNDCPLWTGGAVYNTIKTIIEGLKPFGDRPTAFFGSPNQGRSGGPLNAQGQVFVSNDSQSWDPTNGRFVKTVTWTYQQCTNARNWLDN